MDHAQIRGLDKPVSRLIQGATVLKQSYESESRALCDAALDRGINAFETAAIYGRGDSEQTLGRWIRDRGVRERVVIIDKGAHPDGDRPRVNPAAIREDLHASLARLGTDYIDLYLLHRDDPEAPVADILESLEDHRQRGEIRCYGASNWRSHRLGEALAHAERHQLQGFVASSPHFSLAVQIAPPWPGCVSLTGPDGPRERAWYREHDLALLCWSSLGGGFLSGRVEPGALELVPREMPSLWAYDTPLNWSRLARAQELARAHGLSVPQIALAYVLAQPEKPFAVVCSRRPAELDANARAVDIELGAEELAWLEHGELGAIPGPRGRG